jgi:hypothetical protein
LPILGTSAAARVRFIVCYKDCGHQVEPDPAEQVIRYGAEMTVIGWHKRLVCSQCGIHDIDMVVTGGRCDLLSRSRGLGLLRR